MPGLFPAGDAMLKLDGLSKIYSTPKGEFTALDSVSLELSPGGSLGIVGESGAGKSTLARCLLGVERPSGGKVWFQGQETTVLCDRERIGFWRRAQMIWQDPHLALSPHLRVERLIAEPLGNYTPLDRARTRRRVRRLLEMVELDPALGQSYSHQLSGGQCQRVCIARALAPEPELLVCDEPVSALDLPLQLKVMDLIHGLRMRLGLSLVIITHDLGLARRYCGQVAIMRQGKVVEQGPVEKVLVHGKHPYTRKLLAAVPRLPWGEEPSATEKAASPPGGEKPPAAPKKVNFPAQGF